MSVKCDPGGIQGPTIKGQGGKWSDSLTSFSQGAQSALHVPGWGGHEVLVCDDHSAVPASEARVGGRGDVMPVPVGLEPLGLHLVAVEPLERDRRWRRYRRSWGGSSRPQVRPQPFLKS